MKAQRTVTSCIQLLWALNLKDYQKWLRTYLLLELFLVSLLFFFFLILEMAKGLNCWEVNKSIFISTFHREHFFLLFNFVLERQAWWKLATVTTGLHCIFFVNWKTQTFTSVARLWLAPLSRRNLTTSRWFSWAAIYRGVKPFWNRKTGV